MRALVTGAQGFVGVHLVAELLRRPGLERVVGLGRRARHDAAFTAPVRDARYDYTALDVGAEDALAALLVRERPTAIFHLASGLRDDPARALFDTNVHGTLALLAAVARSGIAPRIVLGSSGGVYGVPERLPIHEDACCRPVDLYAVSKLAAEHAATCAAHGGRLDVVAARLFNLIGPGQDERHASARFAAQLVAVARGRPALIEVGDLTPTRDFVDVRDAATALVLLAEHGERGAYNVGSGVETPIAALLATTIAAAGIAGPLDVRVTHHRAADIPRHVADVSELRALGHVPRFDLAASVADVVRSYTASTGGPAEQIAPTSAGTT